MKKTILLLAIACFFGATILAQPANNPFPKTITVSGNAEMEVVPDEIFVNIILGEYQKRGENKTDLETIKTQFRESCRSAGIADSLVSIAFYSGQNSYNYYYWRKKRKTEFFATITYQVKFKNSGIMDALVDKLDDNATRSFSIVSVSHSKINEFKKQLKIKAVQSAKEKGNYLTEAVGEKLGETITIHEPAEWQQPIPLSNTQLRIRGMASAHSKSYDAYPGDYGVTGDEAGTGSSPDVDFKKMKLKFDVTVVFALK